MNNHTPGLVRAMVHEKCPRCRKGNLFIHKPTWNLKKFDAMPLHCSVCRQSFFPEIGFYYGAMYVSYMISLAFAVPLFFLLWFIFGFHLIGLTVTVSVALLSIFPFAYRYSRVLWIYVNVPFNKELNKEEKSEQ